MNIEDIIKEKQNTGLQTVNITTTYEAFQLTTLQIFKLSCNFKNTFAVTLLQIQNAMIASRALISIF